MSDTADKVGKEMTKIWMQMHKKTPPLIINEEFNEEHRRSCKIGFPKCDKCWEIACKKAALESRNNT